MILDQAQISDIILNNPGKALVLKGCEYSKLLRQHIYGTGITYELLQGYERQATLEMRKKYAKSNKDLFSRLGRPLDKIFTAKGGSVYYNLSDSLDARARTMQQNITNGISLRKWIETVWMPHMLDDPFGVTLLEIMPATDAVKARQQGKSFVYPTYRSIHDIYDYMQKGNRLEWLVLKLSKEEKAADGFKPEDEVYRVIDDAADYIVKKNTDGAASSVTIITRLTLQNFFGEVPAILNSDLADPVNDRCRLSFFDPAIELANEFFLDGSIKRVHKFLHGFPKYSEFADDCPTCKGTGYNGGEKCENCKGSGKYAMTKVSDVKLLSYPQSGEQVILPKEVGGYISPDKVFFDISTQELQSLEDQMHSTIWGIHPQQRTQPMTANSSGDVKTATEVMNDTKPQADRLAVVSEMAEKRHKFILDNVIRLNLAPSYTGASVSYGRRYMLEGPDALWQKYSDARTKGAPQNVLDGLLNDYIDAQYQDDPLELMVKKKLIYVEPFVHMTPAQVQPLMLGDNEYKAKLYFSEWLAVTNEGDLIAKTVEDLKADLATFANAKQLTKPEPKALPVP